MQTMHAELIVPKYPLLATELCVVGQYNVLGSYDYSYMVASTLSYNLVPLVHGGQYAVQTPHCTEIFFACNRTVYGARTQWTKSN